MVFETFLIRYKKRSEREQALEILEAVNFLHQNKGYKKVGITYSANHVQATTIRDTYIKNEWKTGVGGRNQGAVVGMIEILLKEQEWEHLQGVFRLLPVSTCEKAGGYGVVEDTWIDKELDDIKDFAANNDQYVIGWSNEESIQSPHSKHEVKTFAIGGGVSKQLTEVQNKKIQYALSSYAKEYPANLLKLQQQNIELAQRRQDLDALLKRLKSLIGTLSDESCSEHYIHKNRKNIKLEVLKKLDEILQGRISSCDFSMPPFTEDAIMIAIRQVAAGNNAQPKAVLNSLYAGFTRWFFTNRTEILLESIGLQKKQLLKVLPKYLSSGYVVIDQHCAQKKV